MPAAQLDPHIASPARGRQQERLYRNLIRRSGVDVSPAESWVMWHLGARGPHTSAALAVKLGVDRGSLERLYQTLERRGYVQSDDRGLPDLTRTGRRALIELIRAGQREIAGLLSGRNQTDETRTRAMRQLTRAAVERMPPTSSAPSATQQSEPEGNPDDDDSSDFTRPPLHEPPA